MSGAFLLSVNGIFLKSVTSRPQVQLLDKCTWNVLGILAVNWPITTNLSFRLFLCSLLTSILRTIAAFCYRTLSDE